MIYSMSIKSIKKYIPEYLWEFLRLQSILHSHRQTAAFWDRSLEAYEHGAIERFPIKPKLENIPINKVIWQYWGQGFTDEDLPEMVKLCFDSVDRYCGDFKVIRLSDSNLYDYIDLPSYVVEKYNSGVIGRAHFSDIVRLALLSAYGGLWLDATIFLTGEIPEYCCDGDWFMYQRDDAQEDKKLWRRTYAYYFGWHKHFKVRVLNSIIWAKKDNKVIMDLFQLLQSFWKEEEHAPDYFFFQILFTEYMRVNEASNCEVKSDCIPNLLQMYLTGSYQRYTIESILNMTSLHKLSYKTITSKQIQSLLKLD